MTSEPGLPPASTRTLVKATLGAALVAAFMLVAVVLPAEFGMDPLRTGAALGLLRAPIAVDEPPGAPAAGAAVMAPVQVGPLSHYGAPYKVDTATFELGPYEYLEYKYHLAQGASLLYSWEASAPLIHDLHGAPDGGAANAEVSHDKQTRVRASGSLAAPFAGMHGWYWENPGGTPIRIRLTTSGFYTAALETRSNRTRRMHAVEAVPLPPDTMVR